MKARLTRSWLPLLIVVVAAVTAIALAQGSSNGNSSTKGSKASSGGQTVSVTKEKVNGKSEQVLTDSKGMTLYYSTKDTPKTSNCTGACAQTWKPLTVSSGKKPSGSSKVSGDLSTLKRKSGKMQVEYKGHPLYTYSKDQSKGDTKGAGKASFKVATVSIQAAGGGSSMSGGSSSGGSSSGGSSSGGSSSGGSSNGG